MTISMVRRAYRSARGPKDARPLTAQPVAPWVGTGPAGRWRNHVATAPTLNYAALPVPSTAVTGSRAITDDATLLERTLFEVKKVIVGQDHLVERLIVAALAGGHVLLEGLPGLAKTLAAETLATVVGGSFARIQFTTYPVPQPFMVVATQNPIESEGVYPLPEAQRDRFLMKVVVDHPSRDEEIEIVRRMGVDPPSAQEMMSLGDLARIQEAARTSIYVDRGVQEYAVDLVCATRDPGAYDLDDLVPLLAYGASPRASLGLLASARALALLRRRSFALPQDVFDVAPDVLGHRLVLSYEALAQGVDVDHVLDRLLATVMAQRITPTQDGTAKPVPPAPDDRPAPPVTGLDPQPAGGVTSSYSDARTEWPGDAGR